LLGLPLWIALAVAAAVGLYAAAGFWLVPRIIRSQVVEQVATRYHRTASLGEVTFNPFTFRLEASRFRLPDADGRPMLAFGRLTVQPSIASLWRGGLVFSEIRMDEPRMRLVRRANGRVNVQDLAPPPSKARPTPLPKVFIDQLVIRRGVVDVLDRDRLRPFAQTLAPVDFTLRNFSTRSQDGAYVLNATTERDEGLAWRGNIGLEPLASRGSFAVTRVKAAPLAELAGGALPFGISGGQIDVDGRYDFALRGKELKLRADVGDLRLTGVGLRAAGADADWITLPRADITDVHVDMPTRTAVVGRIEATEPQVTAWSVGTNVNLARYAAKPGAAKAPAAAPGPPWKIALPDLRVRGAKVAFEDRSQPTPVRVTATPVDLTITGFALPTVRPIQLDVSAGLEGGGRLAAKGPVTLGQQPGADLDISASDIALRPAQPYIDTAADVIVLSGRASTRGRLHYAGKAATFDGTARVDDLHTVDKVLRQDFVNWRSLQLDGVSARTDPLFVKVRQVTAVRPYARVVIGPNYVMNITTVLNPKGAPARAAAAPKPLKVDFSLFKHKAKPAPPAARPVAPPRKALPIEIALVKVEQGEMDFSDLTLLPNFVAGIKHLDGTVQGLSGRQDARATVDMTGQEGPLAPVKIDGQVNYFAVRSYTDVKMSFRNVEMTTLSPYSGKFAGYQIKRGKLNLDLHYNIDDQALKADHRVVINQLQLGDKVDSADAVKMPVKLIVALLKDKNGVIDVPIKIKGSLDDPKFEIWPVIWQVVRNLGGKIAAAPFRLLGGLLHGGGGGGDDLKHVDFPSGSAALDAADHQRIATVAKALAERPAVNLEAPMTVDPAVDKPALAEARLNAELAQVVVAREGQKAAKPGAVDAALTNPKTRRAALEDLYRQQFGAKPDVPKPQAADGQPKPDRNQATTAWLEDQLRGRITVTDADLQQLGKHRAEAVEGVLVHEGRVDASRVFVTAQAPPAKAAEKQPAKPQEASRQTVRMELSLS
jgi:uncharacterized protein involved in outer membrane biogenesis